MLAQEPRCLTDLGPGHAELNCLDCPDYDCHLSDGNGLFKLKVKLTGSLDCPPYLARLYYRKGRIGRFLIELSKVREKAHVVLYGQVNVRYKDILEWNNYQNRCLGLVNRHGELVRLETGEAGQHFQEYLKEYLKSKRLEYVAPFTV